MVKGLTFCHNSQNRLTKTIVIDIMFFILLANAAASALTRNAFNLEVGHD